jgi:SAM-dependent methyltransferase
MLLDALLGTRCNACRRRGRLQVLGPVASTHNGKLDASQFTLVHCPHCDVVFLSPPPTPRDLRAIYEESSQFDDPHYTDPQRVADVVGFCTDAIGRLELMPPAGGRMLEVGAGLAWMARACKGIDPSVTCIAQDVSAEAAERCPWVDHYRVGSLQTVANDGPFQLASMTHVIEHLIDPAATLAAIADLLDVGGRLFITAPYRPSGWQLADGLRGWSGYSYLHVPAHVTYLSKTWFEIVAPRCNLRVAYWNAEHEDGQAFEVMLQRT